MASVWEPRWASFLKRLAALRESTSLELLPDLMPVLTVNREEAAEAYLNRGERIFSAGGLITAAAGQFASFHCGPPAGTNVLTVIEQLIVGVSITRRVGMVMTVGTIPAGSNPVAADDMRLPAVADPCVTRFVMESAAVAVGAGADVRSAFISQNATVLWPVRFVLVPGSYLTIQNQTAAQDIVVWARGYERVVGQDELAAR